GADGDPQGGRRGVAGQRAHLGGGGESPAAARAARGRGVRIDGGPGAGEAAPHSARGRKRALRQRAGQSGEGQRARRRGGAGAAGQEEIAREGAGNDSRLSTYLAVAATAASGCCGSAASG